MAFIGVKMTEEDKRLVNTWPEEARKLGRDFLEYRLFRGDLLTSHALRMAVDRERGFYFINSAIESLGPEGPVINPTYFFYLWWDGGFIEIYAKIYEKYRSIFEEGKERDKVYYLKYDVFKMYLHQKNTSYIKEYLFSVVKEAFEAHKTYGNHPHIDTYVETVVVNFDKVKLKGDWSK